MEDWNRKFEKAVCSAIVATASDVMIAGKRVKPSAPAARDLLGDQGAFANTDWETAGVTAAVTRENLPAVAAAVFDNLHAVGFIPRDVDLKDAKRLISNTLLPPGSLQRGRAVREFSENVRITLEKEQCLVFPPSPKVGG